MEGDTNSDNWALTAVADGETELWLRALVAVLWYRSQSLIQSLTDVSEPVADTRPQNIDINIISATQGKLRRPYRKTPPYLESSKDKKEFCEGEESSHMPSVFNESKATPSKKQSLLESATEQRWRLLDQQLRFARDAVHQAREWETAAFQAWDDFHASSQEAANYSVRWKKAVSDRREECAAEAEIRVAVRERRAAKTAEEEARRQLRILQKEAQKAQERVAVTWVRARQAELRIGLASTSKSESPVFLAAGENSSTQRYCHFCGCVGVKNHRECPNFANHNVKSSKKRPQKK